MITIHEFEQRHMFDAERQEWRKRTVSVKVLSDEPFAEGNERNVFRVRNNNDNNYYNSLFLNTQIIES